MQILHPGWVTKIKLNLYSAKITRCLIFTLNRFTQRSRVQIVIHPQYKDAFNFIEETLPGLFERQTLNKLMGTGSASFLA